MCIEQKPGHVADDEDEDDHHENETEVFVVPLPSTFPTSVTRRNSVWFVHSTYFIIYGYA